MSQPIYTFRLVDGYTGEILHEVGDRFYKDEYPNNSRITFIGTDDVIYMPIHNEYSFCECLDCTKKE